MTILLNGCFSAVIAFFIVGFGYTYFAAFYRASAREMKRLGESASHLKVTHSLILINPLDSLLRSLLYSHFSESLTGLPTIRSYGEVERFLKDNKYYIDLEDRALYLTVTNQRWMAIRLDFCGAILVCIVSR